MAQNTAITIGNKRDDRFSPNIHQFSPIDEQDQKKWKKVIIAAAVLLSIGVVVVIAVSATTKVEPTPENSPIHFPASAGQLGSFQHAAAAVDAGPCSQIVSDMMQKGGSAVDAAIAAALCTSTTNMYATGIGGGFFMVIWNQTEQKAYVINARETAPGASSKDMFENATTTTTTPLAIAVPGEVAGYWAAHQRFGKLEWEKLFEPTIKICQDGYLVTASQANGISDIMKRIRDVDNAAPFANLMQFLINKDTSRFYQEGETMYCPTTLVNTLQRLAQNGGSDYYTGLLSEDILADLVEAGSIITREDLANYQPDMPEPIDMKLKGPGEYRLVSVPPPGSGALLGLILNIMAGYELTPQSSQQTLTYHRFVEALKFTYGQRMLFGDEKFVLEMEDIVKNLTSIAWADHFRGMISDSKTQPTEVYLPDFIEEENSHGTTHISIMDADGNAVAMTATVNSEFGSGILGSKTGILFNDQMDDFGKPAKPDKYGIPPNPNNYIVPGKRPQSSMCPSIVLLPSGEGKHKVSMIVGASGGSRITSGTAYATTRMIWFDENPKQAVDALRLHHQLIPEVLRYESEMPHVVLESLLEKGHINQTVYNGYISVVQAIKVTPDGTIQAFSDYRKQSQAAGY